MPLTAGSRPLDRPPTIDAHLHVWRRERADYDWLDAPGLDAIAGDMRVADVAPDLDAAGIDHVILVQAADSDADTDAMLDEAREQPRVAGVVAWLPLDQPDAAAVRLDRLLENPVVCGIRSLISTRSRPGWVLGPEPLRTLALLASRGIPFDFVTSDPEPLALLPALSERVPELEIVIDHLGKPPVGRDLAPWRAVIARAAQNPRISAKVSGLYPAAGPASAAQLEPVVDAALELFGADRLMYGSDWPINVPHGGYAAWASAVEPILSALTDAEHAAIRGGSAARVYGLSR